ncbi:hypothetical protein EJB05_30719, partial [Eragrostis curvula]
MATAMVGAAFSVVGKALAPFTDDLLKNWAASAKLGDNVRALELELLSVKALLQPVLHKEIDNSALKELLVMLQDLGYDAEDVLDELDYFRIQDELHGTFEAADEHAKGCACNLFLNAKAVGKQLICLPKANRREVKGGKAKLTSRSCCNPIHAVGKCFPCSSLPSVGSDNSMPDSPERSHTNEPKKLKFNRVDASKRMQHIVEQLRLVHQRVSGIITALGDLNWSTVPSIAQSRPITTSESVEPKFLDHEEFKDLFLDFVFGDDQSRKDHTFLLETGDKIISRLKGNPLAAKTVSRLLKNQLDLVHWTRVLESKEWEQSENKNDIMPALKLSYDYLPSQLQLCFSYCALFPQGYKFEGEEIINFWIGLDVLHLSHSRNKRIEDIGLSHLTQLVNHGFFEKGARSDGTACYIIHDLLVELARNVSSHECLSIDSSQSQVSSLQIRPSIRHLSINIDGTSIKDRLTLKNCLEDFSTLAKRLKVEKLRSLMLFGEHHGCFVKTFGDVFREVKVLRVIFVSQASYEVEDLLQNFYYLVHLRYLRIQSFSRDETRFPNKLSRFYHMMVLDAKHYDNIIDLPRDISNLIKLRHFLVCDEETHASIFEVGKLKSLQELRRFEVKQEDQGFELRQLGQLAELCGSLCIDNLENVQVKEEADEAKLTQKSRLHGLRLCWNTVESSNETALEEQVLERLKPSSNLLKLSITGHRGATCPSWLGINLSVKNLEYLRLSNVAWQTFPPIGELLLVNAPPEEISCKTPDKRFENLRRLELVNLARLKKWDVYAPCQLFPYLEVLVIWGCSNLVELSFPNSTSCQQDKQAFSFPRLLELNIGNCPQLLSFPPVPWTEAPCSIKIEELALQELNMLRCQPLPLRRLQMLSSLRTLGMSCPSNAFPFDEEDNHVQYQFPVELLRIHQWRASGKDLTQLLTYFPKLSVLQMWDCEKITGLGVSVMGHQATATHGPSSSGHKVDQQQDARAEEEIVTLAAEGLLLLPPQLQELWIYEYPEMSLRSNPLNDNKEDGRTRGGGGLQGLSSLRKLTIWSCPKFLSSYYSSCFPFPSSLEYLELEGVEGFETVVPLSNLSSLTELSICKCGDLRELIMDDVAGVTATPICSSIFSSLTTMAFYGDAKVERFTEEQESLLFINSLEVIRFEFCNSLKYLPARLRTLPSLKRLSISKCKAVRMLPENGLPSSLQELFIDRCPEIQSLPKNCLPGSLQKLVISGCPGIRSLPKIYYAEYKQPKDKTVQKRGALLCQILNIFTSVIKMDAAAL